MIVTPIVPVSIFMSDICHMSDVVCVCSITISLKQKKMTHEIDAVSMSKNTLLKRSISCILILDYQYIRCFFHVLRYNYPQNIS